MCFRRNPDTSLSWLTFNLILSVGPSPRGRLRSARYARLRSTDPEGKAEAKRQLSNLQTQLYTGEVIREFERRLHADLFLNHSEKIKMLAAANRYTKYSAALCALQLLMAIIAKRSKVMQPWIVNAWLVWSILLFLVCFLFPPMS